MGRYSDDIPNYSDEELRDAVLKWVEKAVDSFEGTVLPSEIEGKYLVTEMLNRGWEKR